MDFEIIAAIQNQHLIEIVYDGQWMIVQPYCYGRTTTKTECLIAFLVDGHPGTAIHRWSSFDIQKTDDLNVLKQTFYNHGIDYEKWMRQMEVIYARV